MKNIVVTGASRRLGLYLTKEFSERGCRVFAVTRNVSSDLRELESSTVKIIQVSDYSGSSGKIAGSEISQLTDRLDLLVNNASAFIKDINTDNELILFELFYKTHMAFPYALSTALESVLKDAIKPGVVVNMTDIYALNPIVDYMLYCSTKAGLSNLTIGLAKKYAGQIRFNAIAPGPMKFLPEHSEKEKNTVLAQTLIKKEGGFLSILKTIDFIFDNDYLTGTVINVDGGRSVSGW